MLQYHNRFSQPYIDGVNSFIEFAKSTSGGSRVIKCPCNYCCNGFKHDYETVRDHLLRRGMMVSYDPWLQHGELPQSDESDDSEDESDEDQDGYDQLLEDHGRGTYMMDETLGMDDVRNFEIMLEASQRGLYPGCKDSETLLAFVIRMLHVKVQYRWSNKSFDKVLEIFRDTLPEGNVVPASVYEAKKLLRDLGLGYEHIDSCKNDCILFWKENAHLEKCPECGEPRYKVNNGKGKQIAHKILRYFPLIPRLRRLYMSRMTAKEMRWHHENGMDGDLGRHPADYKEWKEFDLKFPEFAREIRNVRLGLATDGFNPFGNMSTSYSMWPVILMPYNLPPWMCMKDPFFMMSLLIPGPQAPGKEIDVYLRPLVDELKELWEIGVMTYDAHSEQTFRMHAAVMWTINDFPAYGNLSGWSTKGYLACPPCNEDSLSYKLRSKIGWVGHRAYLPENHHWRRSKKFNGQADNKMKSLRLPVQKVLDQLDQLPEVRFGKGPNSRKRPRCPALLNWTKKSILYELPYWKNLNLRHNLDVMHVEKNICENIVGTVVGIDKKNKDTDKARDDLKDMGIRPQLHLQRNEEGSIMKPRASYTLDPKQREGLFEFLNAIKYPDGYAANISRCVTSKNGKLSGMKSHDYHVLLQRLLPVGLRGYVDKELSTTLFELGGFFQDLCSKTLKQSDLKKLEERGVLILCKLEKIFPPAFFDVMVHLAVHLPREAMLAGPVQYRWMYPIERYLLPSDEVLFM